MWSGDRVIVWFFWSRDYVIFWSRDCVIQTNLSNCLNLKHHSECFKLAKLVSIFHIFCIQSLLRCWNLMPYCYFIKNCIPANVVKILDFLALLIWHGGPFVTYSEYSLPTGFWDKKFKSRYTWKVASCPINA